MEPRTLHDIPTPAILLDVDRLDANLRGMAERARSLGVRLRPHAKTHKCPEVATRQVEAGAAGLTVSTLTEARIFGGAGFEDLTWAFPLIPGRAAEAAELAESLALAVTVDSTAAVGALREAGARLRVWLEVDCGYGRSGVDPAAPEAEAVARAVAEDRGLELAGLLTHSGHAYHARTDREAAAVAEEERAVTVGLAERLRDRGLAVPEVSVGSTPAMTRARDLTGVTEVRPGNYAFFDGTQVALGACRVSDCALTVLASVVSSRAGRAVTDAGALALSKDTGPAWEPPSFGRLFDDLAGERLHPDARVTSVSQEHGIVNRRLAVGARVRVLPNHSCLTAACHDAYWVVRGEEVVDRWRVRRER